MTKFKLNARAFGGLGLLFIILFIITPLYAGLIETGLVRDLPSNIIQVQEGVSHTFPSSQATVPLLLIMVVSFLAIVIIFREKRKRARS